MIQLNNPNPPIIDGTKMRAKLELLVSAGGGVDFGTIVATTVVPFTVTICASFGKAFTVDDTNGNCPIFFEAFKLAPIVLFNYTSGMLLTLSRTPVRLSSLSLGSTTKLSSVRTLESDPI